MPACTYYYNGEKYSTQSLALLAQKKDLEVILAGIQPLPQPVAERARIGLPDEATISARGVVGGDGEARNFVVEVLRRDYANTAEAIKRRNLFRHTVVTMTHGDDLEPGPGEAVIYLYMPSPRANGWYFKNSKGPRTPIFFEYGESDFSLRTRFFLKSIERLLAGAPALPAASSPEFSSAMLEFLPAQTGPSGHIELNRF